MDACKLTCPKTCHNTTFAWLEHELQSSKSRHIIGAQTRGSYLYRVTVYPYNGYIRSTNPIVRHVMSINWTMERTSANQHALKHPATQTLHGLNMVNLVLGRACSSHVKVMLRHVLGCVDLHASVSWSQLVT